MGLQRVGISPLVWPPPIVGHGNRPAGAEARSLRSICLAVAGRKADRAAARRAIADDFGTVGMMRRSDGSRDSRTGAVNSARIASGSGPDTA